MALDLRIATIDVRLREPQVSRETYQVQRAVVVALLDDDQFGLGEATAFSVYGVTVASLIAALERCRDIVTSHEFCSPDELVRSVSAMLADDPFALCAIDVAAHDLWAKRAAVPLYRFLGLDHRLAPVSSMSIGLDTAAVMIAKARSVRDWPILKIKVGRGDVVALIKRLRGETDAVFRIDANCGWTADQMLRNADALCRLGVESIEQPLPRSAGAEMRNVCRQSALPVIADESCCSEDDLEDCAEYFHGVNIKLMKCGGVAAALRMIEKAHTFGLIVHVGCMPETSIGISAIAHLAAATDGVDMDSIMFLADDFASGAKLERGTIVFPAAPGTGCPRSRGRCRKHCHLTNQRRSD